MVELYARLSKLQLAVTQEAATEPPFQNAYWNEHRAGIYVDIVTGEPLFSSRDKFESGTGWPSFSRPVSPGHVVDRSDASLGVDRTEVVSAAGQSHLGHVFDDGPAPSGMRYCINSAALRFIPAAALVAAGYPEYTSAFGGPGAVVAKDSAPEVVATANKCAVPISGEKPGCHSDFDVVLFAKLDGDGRRAEQEGVLAITTGFEGAEEAVEVTFDPSQVTYAELVKAWTKGRESSSKVFVKDDAQKAAAGSVRVVKAVPFRRN